MAKFYIESSVGVIAGIYEGETAEAAWEAMVADAGDSYDDDGRRVAGAPEDWIVFEVTGVVEIAGSQLYELENGAYYDREVADGHYYRDIEAAREALAD